MSSFDERERAEEKKFSINQELEFKTHARRNKLLGQWAAGLFGLTGAAAAAYVAALITEDLKEGGDEDVFRKLRADFDARNVAQSDHQLRARMADLLVDARAQVQAQS